MSSASRHPTPSRGAVVVEHFRAAGLAVRGVWIALAILTGLLTFLLSDTTGQVTRPEAAPAFVAIPVMLLAVILPQALWRGEGPGRRGYLYSMPVSRSWNQLAKNAAGWGWMMIGSAAIYLWMFAVIVPLTNSRVESFAPWQWLAPFVAATVAFLFAAAIATVFEQPAVLIVAGYFVGIFVAHTQLGIGLLLSDRFSLATMATGSTPDASLERWVTPAPLADWLIASALWLGVGLAVLYLASRLRRDL